MKEKKKAQELQEEETLAEDETAPPEEAIFPEDVEALQQELLEWQAKAEEYLDGWQRQRADFANYKKRVERDQAQAYQSAAASISKRFLDVLDDLDRALANRPQEGDGAAWAEGVELVYRKFAAVLEAEGVKPMEAQGAYFDPNLHEALSNEDSPDHDSGQIIAVVKNGYVMGDKVLRPALVRVAK
jgi:molecular chaperone GrpE